MKDPIFLSVCVYEYLYLYPEFSLSSNDGWYMLCKYKRENHESYKLVIGNNTKREHAIITKKQVLGGVLKIGRSLDA